MVDKRENIIQAMPVQKKLYKLIGVPVVELEPDLFDANGNLVMQEPFELSGSDITDGAGLNVELDEFGMPVNDPLSSSSKAILAQNKLQSDIAEALTHGNVSFNYSIDPTQNTTFVIDKDNGNTMINPRLVYDSKHGINNTGASTMLLLRAASAKLGLSFDELFEEGVNILFKEAPLFKEALTNIDTDNPELLLMELLSIAFNSRDLKNEFNKSSTGTYPGYDAFLAWKRKVVARINKATETDLTKIIQYLFNDTSAISKIKRAIANSNSQISTINRTNALKSLQEFIHRKVIKLNAFIEEYGNHNKAKAFKESTTHTRNIVEKLLVAYEESNNEKNLYDALIEIAAHDSSTNLQIANLLVDLQNNYLNKDNNEFTDSDRIDLTNKLNNIRLFLANVKANKELVDFTSNIPNKTDIERATLDLIQNIKEESDKFVANEQLYNSLMYKYFDVVLESLRAKGIEVEDSKTYIDAIKDINSTQGNFDALMDIDNYLATLITKRRHDKLNSVRLIGQTITSDFVNRSSKFVTLGMSANDRIAFFSKFIDEQGRLIDEFNYEYLDTYEEYVLELSLLRVGSNKYNEKSNEFAMWKAKHLETEFTEEYYMIFNTLSPEQRDMVHELSERSSAIYDKYSSNFDFNNISQTDKKALELIRRERNNLIANDKVVANYYEKVATINKSNTSGIFWADAIKAKAKSEEEYNKFMSRNSEGNDAFWAKIDEIFKNYAKNNIRKEVRKLLKNRLANYYDYTGMLDPTRMSKDEIELAKRASRLSNYSFGKEFMDSSEPVVEAIAAGASLETILDLIEQHGTAPSGHKGLPSHLKKAITAFYDMVEHTPTEYYYNALAEAKKLSADEYDEWYTNNHHQNDFGRWQPLDIWTVMLPKDKTAKYTQAKMNYRINTGINPKYINKNHRVSHGGVPVPKSGKFENDKFKKLTQEEKEYLTYLKDLYRSTVGTYESSFTEQQFIPSESTVKIEGDNKVEKTIKTDVEGQIVYDVLFRNSSKINQKPTIKPLDKLKNETFDEYNNRLLEHVNLNFGLETDLDNMYDAIRDKNNEIRKANSEMHASAVSKDLLLSMPKFIEAGLNYKMKSEMHPEIRLLLSFIRNLENITRDKGMVKQVLDRTTKTKLRPASPETISGKESRLAKRIQDEYRMVFAEQFLDEGKYDKALKVIRTYTSYRGMAWNPFSAVKNVVYGGIMTAVEAGGAMHFNIHELAVAQARVANSITGNMSKPELGFSNIESAMVAVGNILYDAMERGTESSSLVDGTIVDKTLLDIGKDRAKDLFNVGYLGQQAGEYLMQNATLFAMLESHRLIDGKVYSKKQYLESVRESVKGVITSKNKDIAKQLAEKNEIARKNAEAVFEAAPTVYSQFELNNGFLSIKQDSDLTTTTFGELITKVKGVNHKIHGIYNPEDKGAIEHEMLGQMLMQFRHWVRSGWTKRMGTRGGFNVKAFYNVRRDEWDKGSWKVTASFLTSGLGKDYVHDRLGRESQSKREYIKTALATQREYLSNIGLHWNLLSEYDKADVRRTAYEFLAIAAAYAVLAMLKNLDDDEEALQESLAYNFLIYQVDALKSELMAYTPMGWFNEGAKFMKAPMSGWTTVDLVYRFGEALIMFPINSLNGNDKANYYKGGIHSKELKLNVLRYKMTPLEVHYRRFMNLPDNNTFYKLH
jgi:hypothetical protein